jgi:hypothetical protein
MHEKVFAKVGLVVFLRVNTLALQEISGAPQGRLQDVIAVIDQASFLNGLQSFSVFPPGNLIGMILGLQGFVLALQPGGVDRKLFRQVKQPEKIIEM